MSNSKKLLLIILMLLFAGSIYFFVPGRLLVLSLYFLPVLLAAYWFGRKGAIGTALASLGLVVLMMFLVPAVFTPVGSAASSQSVQRWIDVAIWGACLLVTGYVMGELFEREQAQVRELRDTYWGFLPILNLFINKDEYTQNHTYRVSVYAAKIASAMGLPEERIEDVRAAALVRDIGKVKVSREALAKAAKLAPEEFEKTSSGAARGARVGGSLRRVLPIILAQPAKTEGSSEEPAAASALPLEARILAVADVYASLTSDRPYRKAMSAPDAKDVIVRGAGREFDQQVVSAFERAFANREMEVQEGSA